MLMNLARFASGIATVTLSLTTAAVAQDRYRPADERVVCIDEAFSANIYTSLGGAVQGGVTNGTTVQIRDYVFGPEEVPYFEVTLPGDGTSASQTGFVAAANVKNFCGFEARRAVTLQQFRAPPNTCHLIGASRQSVEEVNAFRAENQRFFPSMSVYISDNGWYAISMGLVRIDAFDQITENNQSLPDDAYCSDGANYIGVLEKRADGFQRLDIPAFESLEARFAAARTMRRAADDAKDGQQYKRACDLGDWIACARYANTIRDNSEDTDADIIQRNHYDLLGCMRGSHFGCNNAFNMRRTFIDQVLSPNQLKTGEGRPMVTEELARVGCDGGVWPSCRHLGEETWGDDPIAPAEFPLAMHAMHAACIFKEEPDDDLCRDFAELLESKNWRDGFESKPFGAFEVARINAQSCRHDPNVAFANCADAYAGYGTFLAANVGTAEMQSTARNFLIDGCELGDVDACLAFSEGADFLPERIFGTSDIIRVGRSAYICNDSSTFTNLRNRPTASGSEVLGQIPNGVWIRITDNALNDAGYLYYEIETGPVREGRVDWRRGFVYHGSVSQSCDLPYDRTQAIDTLAAELVATNDLLINSDIIYINANFKGQTLLLTGLPGLQDIAALANLDQLTYLDLSRASVTDLAPLAGLASLETLSLYDTDVAEVLALANLTNLRVLNLYRTNVTDLSAIANLTNLEVLYLPRSDTVLTPIQALIDAGLRVE